MFAIKYGGFQTWKIRSTDTGEIHERTRIISVSLIIFEISVLIAVCGANIKVTSNEIRFGEQNSTPDLV